MDYRQSVYTNGTSYILLESSIRDILSLIKPLEIDQLRRQHVIDDARDIIHSVASLKDAYVYPFGSFISNLYTKWGDLDISVQFSRNLCSSMGKRQKQTLLHEVMMAFQRAGWGHIKFIPHARVPILICRNMSISCDISIDNYVGLIKSKIFQWINKIDERLRDMVLLIKEWAKVHDINDPKAGTLNSYSLCLLVIFHFQTCSPPILPPMRDIYGGNLIHDFSGMRIFDRQIEDMCTSNIARFRSRCRKNSITVHELLISFFEKFARIGDLATNKAICTYSAKWEGTHSKIDWTRKSYKLIVEDPFEQPDNTARAVGEAGLSKISSAFAETYRSLSSSRVLSDKNALLSILVRPDVGHEEEVPFFRRGGTPNRGFERRVTTNYAAAHGPRVQAGVATSLLRNQYRDSGSSSSPASSQNYRGPRGIF